MAHYFVSPNNEKSQKQWEKMYGRTELPVKFPYAHTACTQRWGEVQVYYLDSTAVPAALLDRLATFEARRSGKPYAEARLAVRHEWLIRADECTSASRAPSLPANRSWQPAFSFLRQVPMQMPRRQTALSRLAP